MTRALRIGIVVIPMVTALALAQANRPNTPTNSPNTPPQPNRTRPIYYGPNGVPTFARPLIAPGNNPRVRVQQYPRLDWEFALTSGRDVLFHDSTQTNYQLYVPPTYRHASPSPLILWVSAKPVPEEWLAWSLICTKYRVLFAVAYLGGDEATPGRRMRLTLDVFDDIRRRLAVDTDRVYVGGLSEGARTACELAYAYPEFIGGVVAVGGGGPMRAEPWMRQRVKERLSVALVAGQLDPARVEMEAVRFPVLREQGVEARVWSVPGVGKALPAPGMLEEVFVWMESKVAARKLLTARYPASRVPEGFVPPPDLWARSVVEEALVRMKDTKLRESGLMQLEGVTRRWPTGEAAKEALRQLEKYDAGAKTSWKTIYERQQAEYTEAETKAAARLEESRPARGR